MSTQRSTHSESALRTSHAERSLRTRMRVLTSLVPLALGLLPAACAPATPDDGVSPALETTPVAPALDPSAAIDAPAKKITLVALTPISRAGAPMLSNLADRFTLVDVAQGAARLGKATEPAELDALLEGASALVADVAQLGAQDLETLRPLADAAAEAGVPLVLENITEADRMTALVGLGIKADGALVESWDRARNAKITLLGHSEVTSGGDADQATTSKARKAELGLRYWEMGDAEREAIAAGMGKTPSDMAAEVDEAIAQRDQVLAAHDVDEARPSRAQVETSPDQRAEQVAERLIALRDQPVVKTKGLSLGTYPIGTYKSYVVQQPAYTWQPVAGATQTATMDIQFKVELVASSSDHLKYMVVTDAGSGFNPGTMMFNDKWSRTFFQDSLEVSISHSTPGLTMNSHHPLTVNGESTYDTTSGCSFGGSLSVNGPETSFTCSVSNTSSRTITDFSALDQSAGLTARWNFHMTNAPGYSGVYGGAYTSWDDLIDPVSRVLRDVPALAKSNLDPSFEAIYWADGAFTSTVPLSLGFKQTLRNTWLEDWKWVTFDKHTLTFTREFNLPLLADFSRVSTYQAWTSLAAVSSSKCVNVEGAGSVIDAPVSQRTCTEANNQLFELVKTVDQDGYSFIKPKQGSAYNMCLTVVDASTGENEKIIQAPCLAAGNDHQRFMLVDAGSNTINLKAKHSNKCLSVANLSATEGLGIVQQTCANNANQRFHY